MAMVRPSVMGSLYRSCCATALTSPAAGRTAYVLTALLPQLQLMGLPFRSPGQRPLHGMAKHEVGARQQRLVQVGQHPFRSIPRRVVLEPAAAQRADAHDYRPSFVKATAEVAEGGQEGGLVAVLAERGVLVPPGRLQDPPGNPALLDPLPAVVRPTARGWRPIVRLLDGLPPPLLQVNVEREFLGHSLSVKEGIAGLDRAGFSLPVDQDDTGRRSWPGHALEERPQIALSLLAPIMHDDPLRPNLDQVQPASPGDKPDDAMVVRRRQFPQARRGSLQDRLLCICQRPGHGIVHGPGFPGGRVQKPERPGVFSGTQALGQEERRSQQRSEEKCVGLGRT